MALFGPIELARVLLVRPEIRAAVLSTMTDFEAATGHKTFVPTDGGYRTSADQARIYADSLAGAFRAAPAGESPHEYGAAIDLQIVGTEQNAAVDQQSTLYHQLAVIGQGYGLRAGYFFRNGLPDPYHFDSNEDFPTMQAKWEDLKKKISTLRGSSWPSR